jgi:CRP/FNR family transcriptional regulator, nitrogen oxide reductase regulator
MGASSISRSVPADAFRPCPEFSTSLPEKQLSPVSPTHRNSKPCLLVAARSTLCTAKPRDCSAREAAAFDARLALVQLAPLFRRLAGDQATEIAAKAHERGFSPGQSLFREDDPVRFVFVIIAGHVKITQLSRCGKEVILRVSGPGELVGRAGVELGTTHWSSAQAMEPCQVLTWEIQAFESFWDRFPVLPRNAAKILAEDLYRIEERFREMATSRVPQRLANVLLRLLGGDKGTAHTLPVRLSCEELAQMTGTTLFTVSRLLCDWAGRGIIEPESKAILIRDLSALTKVAEGATDLAYRTEIAADHAHGRTRKLLNLETRVS